MLARARPFITSSRLRRERGKPTQARMQPRGVERHLNAHLALGRAMGQGIVEQIEQRTFKLGAIQPEGGQGRQAEADLNGRVGVVLGQARHGFL